MNINDREFVPAVVDERRTADYADYENAVQIDLRAIWSAIYRNWIFILSVVALALAVGVASILLTSPIYRARTTVQVEQQSIKVLGTEDIEPVPTSQETERFLQTQIDILKSRALATGVAEKLKFFGNNDFIETMGESPVSDAADVAQREQVLSILQENLSISLPRNSRIVAIDFRSRNPRVAAAVTNTFADNFIRSNLSRKFETSSYSRDFLQGQLAETKIRLEQSERELIDYARAAQLIDASAGTAAASDDVQGGPRSLTTSNLVQLNQAYAQARAIRVQAQQKWEQSQNTPLMSLPDVLGNTAIQQLSEKRAELRALYQQERQRRKEDHPAVQQAAANLSEMDRQITTLATSIRNSILDQYRTAARQEQALEGNVEQLKGETLSEQDRGVRYNILKREVDTNRELYNGLLQRFKELSAEAGVTDNNISVIDRADPPLIPIAPRASLNMAIAGLGGLALALFLVFVRERFNDVIRSPEDVDRKLNLPLLGVLPLLADGETPRAALENPKSSLSEAHFALRTSLELSPDGVPRTLLLTSSRQSEGKSTTAFAIARDFAAAKRRVLLIDADLRKPTLHRLLDLPNSVGLSSLLARQTAPADAIQASGVANLDFVPSGPLPPSPAELLASDTLIELLSAFERAYDLVVIDGPPVLGLADSPRLAAAAHGTVFVIEANEAHRNNVASALKRLRDARARLLGGILTKFDAKKVGYGSDYGYYSYNYGKTDKS